MAPSNFMQLIRKAASSRYGATDLLLLLIVLSTLSASLRPWVLAGGGYKEGPLLSLLLSPRFSYHLCLYLCGAFVIYLIFYYPANKKSYHSRLYILSAALLFLPARHLLPCFFNTAIDAFLTLPWRIQVGVGVSMLTALILRPGFTSLHLVATGLILVLVLAVQSLLPFLPAALLSPTTVLSVLLFLYYLPAMPNFILSFAPIIRRTMAAILLSLPRPDPPTRHLLSVAGRPGADVFCDGADTEGQLCGSTIAPAWIDRLHRRRLVYQLAFLVILRSLSNL